MNHSLDLDVQYMREDARRIPFDCEMDLVINLFTSFGYFSENEENDKVLQQVHRALKPGGYFLFDYLNPEFVKHNLVPFNRTTMDQLEIFQYRSLHHGFVKKTIVIKENGNEREYVERIKLYTPEELIRLLNGNQLVVTHLFGDYDASEYVPSHSPRMIFICQKKFI